MLLGGGGVTRAESPKGPSCTFALLLFRVTPPPPREWEGKEWCEADGHCGLRKERPREGKGKGRGKVRAGRKRKVKGWSEADGHQRLWRERVQGKGSEWRSASRRRRLQTRSSHHGVMPTPPPPRSHLSLSGGRPVALGRCLCETGSGDQRLHLHLRCAHLNEASTPPPPPTTKALCHPPPPLPCVTSPASDVVVSTPRTSRSWGTPEREALPEGRRGAAAALVSRGPTVPLARTEHISPQGRGASGCGPCIHAVAHMGQDMLYLGLSA